MSDIVFCTDCKWFIKNQKGLEVLPENPEKAPGKVFRFSSAIYKTDEATNTQYPIESYWDCSHQFNIGKKIEWWGLLRYYKRKPSQINAKNDCVRFERRKRRDDKR